MRPARTCSPTPLEQIRHGRMVRIAGELRREIIESLLGLGQRHGAASALRTSRLNGSNRDDSRRGLAVTQDENLLPAMLGVVHDLRKVSLDIGQRTTLHMTNMTYSGQCCKSVAG